MKHKERRTLFSALFPFVATAIMIALPLHAHGEETAARHHPLDRSPIFDMEITLGAGRLPSFGNYGINNNNYWFNIEALQADLLFSLLKVGRDGAWMVGHYTKFSLLGSTPQIATGMSTGYMNPKIGILLNTGAAYSFDHLGDHLENKNGRPMPGQAKWNHDLRLTLRYYIHDNVYIATGIGHGSSGKQHGLNIYGGKGKNYGFDYSFIGVGVTFDLFGK